MRRGQVTALLILAAIPLTAVALAATLILGAPVTRVSLERRAQAVALVGAHALAAGATPAEARQRAEEHARSLGVASAQRTIEVERRRVVVMVELPGSAWRVPGAGRPLDVALTARAAAHPSTTQDGDPGAVLGMP